MKVFWVSLLVCLLLIPGVAFAFKARHRRLVATVTAYCTSRRALTASGTPACEGVLACPRKYPFGTRFKIDGRIYVCRDRLSHQYGNRFDIWKPTRGEARAFGKRRIQIVEVLP